LEEKIRVDDNLTQERDRSKRMQILSCQSGDGNLALPHQKNTNSSLFSFG